MADDKEFLKRIIVASFNRRGRGATLTLEKIKEDVHFVLRAEKFNEYFLPAFEELVQDGHLEHMAKEDKYRLFRQLL